MSVDESDPLNRIAQLREALLGGRGPGASEDEVIENTRDRPILNAMPVSPDRALAARRAGDRWRAEEPVTVDRTRAPTRVSRGRAALIGAAAALFARSIGARWLRVRGSPNR